MNSVEGKAVVVYRGIVFGEVTTEIRAFKGLEAGLRNIFGGHSKNCEDELMGAREEVLAGVAERAKTLGTDTIIGIKMDYEVLSNDSDILMVTCSGIVASAR